VEVDWVIDNLDLGLRIIWPNITSSVKKGEQTSKPDPSSRAQLFPTPSIETKVLFSIWTDYSIKKMNSYYWE
jgi:hypothetical protein